MKKFFALALSCAMALSMLAGCGSSGEGSGDANADASVGPNGNPIVKIGVYEPQTGDNGPGGKQEILGMQYANAMME